MAKMNMIKSILTQMIGNIDAGNSNLNEEEMEDALEYLKKISDKDSYLSKEEAAKYLNMGVQNFDVLRRKGDIPDGIKRIGITNLLWNKKVLDKYIKDNKDKDKSANKYCTRK